MTFVDTIDWASHDPEAVFFDASRVRDTAERVEALTAMLEFGWAPPIKLLPELADNPELCAQDAQSLKSSSLQAPIPTLSIALAKPSGFIWFAP